MVAKKRAKKPKIPSVIIEKTFIDEKHDRVFVRQYDANAKNNPPKKKQLLFDDPHDEGCVAVDWSEGAETILHLFGVEYTIMDFGKNTLKKKGGTK